MRSVDQLVSRVEGFVEDATAEFGVRSEIDVLLDSLDGLEGSMEDEDFDSATGVLDSLVEELNILSWSIGREVAQFGDRIESLIDKAEDVRAMLTLMNDTKRNGANRSLPEVGRGSVHGANEQHRIAEFKVVDQPEGWDNREHAIIEYGGTLNAQSRNPQSFHRQARLKVLHEIVEASYMEAPTLRVDQFFEHSVVVKYQSQDISTEYVEYTLNDDGTLQRVR